MAQQLKHELQLVKWPGQGGEVVFGSNGAVRVFAGVPTEEQMPPSFPFAMVGIGSGLPDDDDPNLISQTFTILSAVMVKGDPMGEYAIIGGSTSDLLSSKGRGSAEVSERARSAVVDLIGGDGDKITVNSTATSTPALLTGHHIVVEEFEVTVLCTSQLHYAQPQEFANSGSTWTWAGAQCSSRFDFMQFRIGSITGSTPKVDPNDTDIVATVVVPTVTGLSPTVGEAYSVFADYSSRGQLTVIEGSSDGSEVGAFLTT